MRTTDELIKLVVERLVRLLFEHESKPDTPEPRAPRPEPPEPRKLRQSEQPGLDMNDLIRSIPKPRPPRAPGMQSRRCAGALKLRRNPAGFGG